jgi:hypothetical protein
MLALQPPLLLVLVELVALLPTKSSSKMQTWVLQVGRKPTRCPQTLLLMLLLVNLLAGLLISSVRSKLKGLKWQRLSRLARQIGLPDPCQQQ